MATLTAQQLQQLHTIKAEDLDQVKTSLLVQYKRGSKSLDSTNDGKDGVLEWSTLDAFLKSDSKLKDANGNDLGKFMEDTTDFQKYLELHHLLELYHLKIHVL